MEKLTLESVSQAGTVTEKHCRIPVKRATLDGILYHPPKRRMADVSLQAEPDGNGLESQSRGMVIFSHGSGSSHHSPRNQFVARHLSENGLHSLLCDLLTPGEDQNPSNRFDIDLLSSRLEDITQWVKSQQILSEEPVGFFGASTGAASALRASIALGPVIQTVVSRGGRPDLLMDRLHEVRCPTLLIVGELDFDCIRLNQHAFDELTCEKRMSIIPGASHLFEEKGALAQVADLSLNWFRRHLNPLVHAHSGTEDIDVHGGA